MSDPLIQQLEICAAEVVDGLVAQYGDGCEALTDLANFRPAKSKLDELVILELRRRAAAAERKRA
jgi:hypothetical protein